MRHPISTVTPGKLIVLASALALCGLAGQLISTESSAAAPAVKSGGRIEYNRDIRPILAENCFACHGPDSAARKADLRLDQREVAVKTGAIVPGHAEKSALVERIFAKNSDVMPPRRTQKKLTQAQKDLLKRWIESGAEYQPHWSFLPPIRPPIPAVKNTGWVRNPIDNFILAELEKRGLEPAPEADRRTLARRASLDLTGLPPCPEEVEAFVNDKAPNAYERYVDRLLESPAWGEHRGRYWLDVARYADTHGIHFDNYREIWAYRDWVIQAFNKNMPFDQFTIEQLAGDLLPGRTLDQQVATGFNRCNITTNEGGAISEEYLVLYTRDRTETTSQTWLGLTAGCAVCHDHKYDPLSQKEFYKMSAFFNNTTQAAMDGNIKDTPPTVFVPLMEDRPRWERINVELADTRKQMDRRKQAARADFNHWLKSPRPDQDPSRITSKNLRFHALLNEGAGKTLHVQVDGKPQTLSEAKGIGWAPGHVAERAFKSAPGGTVQFADVGDFDKNQAFSFAAWIKLPRNNVAGAAFARMDNGNSYRGWDLWVENNQVGTHIIHKWPDDALKVTSRERLKAGQWNHVLITYDGSGKAAGVRIYLNGRLQTNRDVFTDKLMGTIRTKVPFTLAQRSAAERIEGIQLQDVRIYGCALPEQEAVRLGPNSRAAWLASRAADKLAGGEKDELFSWWLANHDMSYQVLSKKVGELQQEEGRIKSRGTIAHVMQERPQPAEAYVLFRGDYEKRREKVKPTTPSILPPMPPDYPRNRLGFARWLLRPEHPLTARVTVNRFWQEVFGTGIVRTSGDFGVAGELPSHPELLDWLAVEFREKGWDIKRFFKMIVTSATYRQAAVVTKEKLEKDPQNRLLSRGSHFRLDGEMIRDYALSASGLLVRKIGGPSVKPYMPEGVWEAVGMIGSNTREYRQEHGGKLYRRSMYTFWKRAAPPPTMEVFNAPSRETCTVRRERTNTPLQALVTLNDPQFVEAARHLAELAMKNAGNNADRQIDFMARRLLCRPFRPDELGVVRQSLGDLRAYYNGHADDARKLIAIGESRADSSLNVSTLAALTMLANEMFNLDEVLNK
jgi:hypothetical protein